MCHRCGEHRSHCICTPSKSELKRRAAMGAPERLGGTEVEIRIKPCPNCERLRAAIREALLWCPDCGGDGWYHQRTDGDKGRVECFTCSEVRALADEGE